LPSDAFAPTEVFFTLGLIQAQQGDVQAAFETFGEAAARALQSGQQHTLARLASGRAWLERELGEPSSFALDDLGECTPETRADQLMALADVAAQAGDFARAERALREAADLIDTPSGAARCHVRRCRLRLEAAHCKLLERAGEHEQLERRARSLEALATSDGARRYMALARAFVAEAAAGRGDNARADHELRGALELFDAFPAPLSSWKLWARLGRVLGAGSATGELAFRTALQTLRSIVDRCDVGMAARFLSSPLVRDLIPATLLQERSYGLPI